MSLFNELKRRNVFRVVAAYVVTAWLIIQVAETLFPIFGFSDDLIRLIVISLAIGLLPALFFSWAFELTPGGLKREEDVAQDISITRATGKNLDRIFIILLAIGLAFFAFDKFVLDPSRDAVMIETASRDAVQSFQSQVPDNSIAVLPFVNMTADPEQDFFSDGITEEILNALAQVKELKVAGRTSSFSFKGRNEDLREIGELLSVAHVLEGSVRKAGNRIRITAQLIKVADGYHLWSETYDRELTDIFAIQDDISAAILSQLTIQLLQDTPLPIVSKPTDVEAYELYLQSRQLIYERKGNSIVLAAKLLERAISLDPSYAPIHAQMGIANLMLDERVYGDIPHDLAGYRARKQLDKALELDPNLAEAWAGLGLYYIGQEQEAHAITALETALSINPNLIDAHHWLQNAKSNDGKDLDGIAAAEEILKIDPLYTPAFGSAVRGYNWTGQPDRAWGLIAKAKPLIGGSYSFDRAKIYTRFYSGQYALGLSMAENESEKNPTDRILREILCFAWNSTHQFERTIEHCTGHPTAIANWQLGRLDKALSSVHEPATIGLYYEPYFQVLNASGMSRALIDFVESRWDDLEILYTSFDFNSDIMGYAPMNEIALAYHRLGNVAKVQEALALVQRGQAHLQANGRDNIQFSMNRAVYHALVGDHDAALDHLAASIDRGYIGSVPLTKLWPALQPLENNPRYKDIQARMITHLNKERTALGLETIGETVDTLSSSGTN